MRIRSEFTCPLELVHDTVEGKRELVIIFNLRKGSYSFPGLLHGIEGIGQEMLLGQLKELKQPDLVRKKSYADYPLKAEYFLTGMGPRVLLAIEIV